MLDSPIEQSVVCADARRFIDKLDADQIDAVITDPPYGVAFHGKETKRQKQNGGYAALRDDEQYIGDVVVPIIRDCIDKFGRVVVMPGTRSMWLYPRPDDVGSVYCPSGAGLGRWGFVCSHPILYYGKCPYLSAGLGHRPTGFTSNDIAADNGHPCPKPISWMRWLVRKATLAGETVFDPFCGSGTTGVACVHTGRGFVGCDIEPAYVQIANKQIEEANGKGSLFAPRMASLFA